MVKNVFFISLLFLSSFAFGQQFSVDYPTELSGIIGEEIANEISITNTGDETIQLNIIRKESTIGSSQKTWFCWKDECYDPSVTKLPLTVRLAPGETISDLRTFLTAGISEGISQVVYAIREEGKPTTETLVTLDYTIENNRNFTGVYSSRSININDVYPNPVREFVTIDYNILTPESEYKILIHSVLGSVVSEEQLQPLESQVKIRTENYNPGVYFITLYIDNEGVMTQKMIVQE